MSAIRALYVIANDSLNHCLFSRRFPTVENRLKKSMKTDYIPIPSNDKIIINSFNTQVIREELLHEAFKHKQYDENSDIDHLKFEELIGLVEAKVNPNSFEYSSECPIISLNIGHSQSLWPCLYLRKYKLYAIAFNSINTDLYSRLYNNNLAKKEGDAMTKEKYSTMINKMYEESDISIVTTYCLLEQILKYICEMKSFEENKFHALISNMVPFGNIIETNFVFMNESLAFLNQKFMMNNGLFSTFSKSSHQSNKEKDDKSHQPGWSISMNKNASETLIIELKEELRYVKYKKDNSFNIVLFNIIAKADLTQSCEVTLPLKEAKGNHCLGNLRINPCAKIEDQTVLNETKRIVFVPPQNKIDLGVVELENVKQKELPIIAALQLKEANQNEVKIYLKVNIAESAIGNFDFFYITIPLGHFGTIINTKIMVQVGEVSLVNDKTTLRWDLQNKVFDNSIVLSGTIFYSGLGVKSKASMMNERSRQVNDMRSNEVVNSHLQYNIEEMIKREHDEMTSDIRDNNCFCKISFQLHNYSISGIEMDKKSFLFYPKLTPSIEIKRHLFSFDYIVWNDLSFNNYEINLPNKDKADIPLHSINIEEDSYNMPSHIHKTKKH